MRTDHCYRRAKHLLRVSDIRFLNMPSSFSRVLQKCFDACSSTLNFRCGVLHHDWICYAFSNSSHGVSRDSEGEEV